MYKALYFFIVLTSFLLAEEKAPFLPEIKEEKVETHHKASIEGNEITYRATAGTLNLKNKADKVTANLFYVSYTKDGVDDLRTRPITFCFNGGPGSSSIWLHMGLLGPKRVELSLDSSVAPPYQMIDNEYSLLDVTDLVFIDPVSTGFSKAAPGEDPKQFHGVDEDVNAMAEFIRQWTTQNKRWNSPKYIAGESYGATRAAGLALRLHDDEFFYINGVILISSVLNYQTILDPNDGNDLPYILTLPSFTSTAWYHKKLPEELQKDYEGALKESEEFALNELGPALLKGDALDLETTKNLQKKLARLTGLSELFVERSKLRIPVSRFAKELLRNERRTVGRFDSRLKGIDSDLNGCLTEYDPSLEAVAGAYTATFNQYLRSQLKWETPGNYKVAAFSDVFPWNWGKSTNSYLNVGDKLREVMSKNPSLRVFVACGQYDLATPYFATEYTFSHLNLDRELKKNVRLYYYEGGHMMYTDKPTLIQLKRDLSQFYQK